MCETHRTLSSAENRKKAPAMMGADFDADKLLNTRPKKKPTVSKKKNRVIAPAKEEVVAAPETTPSPVIEKPVEMAVAPAETVDFEGQDLPSALAASATEARQRVAAVVDSLSKKARNRVGDAVFAAIQSGDITSVQDEQEEIQRLAEGEVQRVQGAPSSVLSREAIANRKNPKTYRKNRKPGAWNTRKKR